MTRPRSRASSSLLAEELAGRIAQADKLERENRYYRQRLEETEHREHQLQQTLLRAQKVSDDITVNARREAELMVREAEMAADKIVQQAIEQSTRFEAKITDLRTARRELQLKFKNTLDLFQRILEAEMEDERNTATVPPCRASGGKPPGREPPGRSARRLFASLRRRGSHSGAGRLPAARPPAGGRRRRRSRLAPGDLPGAGDRRLARPPWRPAALARAAAPSGRSCWGSRRAPLSPEAGALWPL